MKNRAWIIGFVFLLVMKGGVAYSQEEKPGGSFCLEADMGSMGILSLFEAGCSFEPVPGSFFIRVKARMASSLTWATYIPMDGSEPVSFHPVLAAGVVSFGGYSPLIRSSFRMYGGTDLLVGYSFTPYEDLILDTGNLIGDNVSMGVFGYFGAELFTAKDLSVFIEAGGGFKTLSGDDENLYAVASSWLGSGFGIRTGIRWYP